MLTRLPILGLGFSIAMALSATASAQTGNRPVELNVHAGGLFWDDKVLDVDPQLMVGGRLVLQRPSGWGFGGNVDYSSTTVASADITTWFLSGEVDYTFPSSSRAKFFVGAGLGAAQRKFKSPNIDSSGDFWLIPVGAGLKWFNSIENPRWLIRADARDNILWANDEATEEDDKGARNNFELSAGLSILLGGS